MNKTKHITQEGWQPIETLSAKDREMFVVRAFDVCNGFTGSKPYTSDPWCVWREKDGSFARWPHHFPPTHWHALPPPPAQERGGMNLNDTHGVPVRDGGQR